MQCTKCNAQLTFDERFCGECGQPVAVTSPITTGVCPNCGAMREPGESFCGECGQDLRGPLPSDVSAEKTLFSVTLIRAGEKKIQVIKEVCSVARLGLKDAKDLVESAPKPVMERVSRLEAEKIKAKLERLGAVVELR